MISLQRLFLFICQATYPESWKPHFPYLPINRPKSRQEVNSQSPKTNCILEIHQFNSHPWSHLCPRVPQETLDWNSYEERIIIIIMKINKSAIHYTGWIGEHICFGIQYRINTETPPWFLYSNTPLSTLLDIPLVSASVQRLTTEELLNPNPVHDNLLLCFVVSFHRGYQIRVEDPTTYLPAATPYIYVFRLRFKIPNFFIYSSKH